MSITVEIVNTYEDGHESSRLVTVDEPEDPDNLDDWWSDVVFPETGDGHGKKHPKLGCMYEATIIDAADPALRGLSQEWD